MIKGTENGTKKALGKTRKSGAEGESLKLGEYPLCFQIRIQHSSVYVGTE